MWKYTQQSNYLTIMGYRGQRSSVNALSQELAASAEATTANSLQVSYSQDVAASSEEQLASMEQIQYTAHSLSDLSQQLQTLIDRLHAK